MSTFNSEDLESPQNITVPIESRTILINEGATDIQLKLNTQYQFGKIAAKFKIVNEDAVNEMTYRVPSPSAPLRTVPPSSSTTVEEYTHYLEINFNIVNDMSYVELDLVKLSEARGNRKNSLVGQGAA